MAKVKNTSYYLEQLQNKSYRGHGELLDLYNKWKENLDNDELLNFLDIIGKEKDNIKPKYLGENTYSNFRGNAFEEFCFDKLDKLIKESGASNAIEIFWNKKILSEEFYIFENGKFNKYPKYKSVDIVMGKQEDNLIHPLAIISCKIWQSTNWLDEDRAVFDNVRNRYPDVLGYSLCTSLSASRVSLISSRRTGLKVFDLSKGDKFPEIIRDIKEVLES